MADKKQPEFTVTDRRRFTSEGDATSETPREQQPEAPEPPPVIAPEPPKQAAPEPPKQAAPEAPKPDDRNVPPPPSAAERQAQHDAFKESSKKLDAQIPELGGRRPQDFEVNFERFIASLYMSALMQMGLMHEQGGQPGVDLLGAHQTIDTLGMLADKTKGNLSPTEDNLMQNVLYELRMAYVEVTNAIARGPQTPPGAPPPPGSLKTK